jgi:syntenin-1
LVVVEVHDLLKKAGDNNIVLAVRDRPFERAITLHKVSTTHPPVESESALS